MKITTSRLFLVTTFVTFFGSAAQAAPFGPSTGDLYDSCRATDSMNAAYCIGYLKAYRDWYQVASDQLVGDHQRYCEPENIDYRDFQRVLLDYFKGHPKILKEPRLLGVTEALHSTWPCPDFNLKIIQTLLPLLGYETGNSNGLFNEKTRTAIKTYKKDFNLGQELPLDTLLKQILKTLSDKKLTLKQEQ